MFIKKYKFKYNYAFLNHILAFAQDYFHASQCVWSKWKRGSIFYSLWYHKKHCNKYGIMIRLNQEHGYCISWVYRCTYTIKKNIFYIKKKRLNKIWEGIFLLILWLWSKEAVKIMTNELLTATVIKGRYRTCSHLNNEAHSDGDCGSY